MELKAKDQASTSAAAAPPPRHRDAKSLKLPSFIDEKDELDSYLLLFELYTANASWEKNTWAIKLSAPLTGRVMDVYTRMPDADNNDYDKLKKAILTKYNYTNGYRKRIRKFGELPSQVNLIVKEQFINACSEELAVYLLERGPNDLVELTTWAQQYLIAYKQQLGDKTKSTVQPKRADFLSDFNTTSRKMLHNLLKTF